jgi:hypothetical protein
MLNYGVAVFFKCPGILCSYIYDQPFTAGTPYIKPQIGGLLKHTLYIANCNEGLMDLPKTNK